tara:strand:- start:2645 stop:3409 length:765 start_codon:yes stop_codon:yes gene_type:complete
MARQKGIIKLEGTIGDVSFYKSKDGYLAREKGGVDAERIKNDPAFQRTRENGSEFGRAGKAGKTLRTALRLLIQNASDGKVASRLTKEMMRVLKTDATSNRGERTVSGGEQALLKGFDFNVTGKLAATLYAQYEVDLDRAAGTSSISFDDFIPANTIAFPGGATHMKLVAGLAEVDFINEAFLFERAESGMIVLGQNPVQGLSLDAAFTADSALDLFLVLGIEFYQDVNGNMYPLKNGSYNPLAIVANEKFVQP